MTSKRFAFVLRLWVEVDPVYVISQPEVRGSLQLVGAEQVYYFDSLARVPVLLAEITGLEAGAAQIISEEQLPPAE